MLAYPARYTHRVAISNRRLIAFDETGAPCPCCGGRMRIIETFGRWLRPCAPPHASAPTGATS